MSPPERSAAAAPLGVNGRFLLGIGRGTGVHRVAWNWLRSLAATAPGDRRFIVAAPSTPENAPVLDSLRSLDRVEVVPAAIRGRAAAHLWEQTRMPSILRARGCAALLNLANTMPLRPRMPSLLAVMDVSFLERAEWFGARFRWLYRLLLPACMRRASRLVTISEFSRREIIRRLGIPAERIDVVPLGIDHAPLTLPPVAVPREGPAWQPPARPYILSVGTLEPRKNIPLLIEAYRMLRERAPGLPHALLLAGGTEDIYTRERLAAVGGVHLLGYLSESDLDACYRQADLFVYPSLYEGFGLPPLEAMARGTATAVSRAGALPEAVGEGAVLFDPGSAQELSCLLERLLGDPMELQLLAKKGLERAGALKWESAGRRFNQILDGWLGAAGAQQ